MPAHRPRFSITWLLGVPLALLGASCLTSGLDQYDAGSAGGAGGGASTSRGTAGGNGAAGQGGDGGQGQAGAGGSACNAMCGGACVNLDTDPMHCGSCQTACPGSYGCSQGICDNVPQSIAAGEMLTCVVLHGGELWCWGRDVWGEVGILPAQTSMACADESNARCQPQPIKVTIPSGRRGRLGLGVHLREDGRG